LFAANPLGRSIFDPKQQPLNLTLEKGQSASFRYRMVLYSHAASPEESMQKLAPSLVNSSSRTG